MAYRDEYTSGSRGYRMVSPKVEEILYEGGRRYEGYQELMAPITDDGLDHQTRRFHEKVTDSYGTEYPSRKAARWMPNASSGQVHDGREIFYSSTERVNSRLGQGIGPSNAAYNLAVERAGFARHNSDNRCAESGTTGMIQRKYGNDVSMRGDRISTYGMIPDEEGQDPTLGFHPGCASRRRPDRPDSMGCEDVLDAYGIIDIHGRHSGQGYY